MPAGEAAAHLEQVEIPADRIREEPSRVPPLTRLQILLCERETLVEGKTRDVLAVDREQGIPVLQRHRVLQVPVQVAADAVWWSRRARAQPTDRGVVRDRQPRACQLGDEFLPHADPAD